MKTKILPLAFLFIALSSTAQDSSFQLKNYKFRTPGFRTLNLNIGFSGNVSTNSVGTEKLSSNSFSLSPSNISYSKIVSTDKRLTASEINFSAGAYSYNQTVNNKDVTNKNIASQLRWNYNDRFYRNKLWFFETGNDMLVNYTAGSHKDTINHESNHFINFEDKLFFGFGKGRLEIVTDAQMALFIINDLQAQGLINKVTPEQAHDFAKLITHINTQRIFDGRRKRIYELTMIDSFLRNSGLAPITNIRHFTTINDNWSLAFNPYRLSGSAFYVRLKPGFIFGKNVVDTKLPTPQKFSNSNHTYSIGTEIGFEIQKPSSIRWQRKSGINAGYEARKHKDIQNAGYYNLSAFHGISYYPNNRTILDALLSVNANHYRSKNQQNITTKSSTLTPAFNFLTTYFLSYRTRLNANFIIQYSKYSSENQFIAPSSGNGFNSGISFNLNHTIF